MASSPEPDEVNVQSSCVILGLCFREPAISKAATVPMLFLLMERDVKPVFFLSIDAIAAAPGGPMAFLLRLSVVRVVLSDSATENRVAPWSPILFRLKSKLVSDVLWRRRDDIARMQ
jgi:hypothetical protein